MCTTGGYAVSQVRPDFVSNGTLGAIIGFGFGGILIGIDEMLKGFSLRAFSATTFGLFVGSLSALLIDHSGLFEHAADDTRWLIRLGLFLGFGYIGMVLAMRSNKEDFSLIIPYVRFSPQNKPDNLLLLDTSVIIDGRIADIAETGFIDGAIVIPQFVLRELQLVADSSDSMKRNRGRRGLDVLQRIQKMAQLNVQILEDDFPNVREVDMKLIELAKVYDCKIVTNDFNLNKVAQLHGVEVLNINELANALKPVVLPGEIIRVFILKEGKEYNQGVAYLDDGTMVVVDNARKMISKTVDVSVTSVLQTTAGKMIFGRFDERTHSVHEKDQRPGPSQPREQAPAASANS
jgi:uncharacterized protein YacL